MNIDQTLHLSNSKTNIKYQNWDSSFRLLQISAVTFLTAVLYIVYSYIGKPWAPIEIQMMMYNAHIFVNVPILLLISFLAYKKRSGQILMPILAIYSVISISIHSYILSFLPSYTPFLTEGYLGVLWIFIVSGMTFRFALVSASCCVVILLVSASFYMKELDAFVIHSFWIICSFSFGFLGALLFERSRKKIFQTQQELEKLAITDALTGVFNRNKMNQIVPEEIARAHRYASTFGFLMIDIDHFKKINDAFGHDIGDQVIKKIARLLSASIRDNDMLVRWGGEEFVIVALEVNSSNLESFSNKLRETIEEASFDVVGNVTISIGATLLMRDDTQDSILLRADQALYQAKDLGRNNSMIKI